jgi:hypothetical protein
MSVLTTFASITRPDAWDFPLFLHILGGMVMVGALTLSLVSLAGAWRTGSPALTRLGYRALLWGAIPGFIVLRAAAQWIADKEHLTGDNVNLTWIDIGFTVTDLGVLLLIIATILGGVAARRAGRGGGPSISARVSTGLVSVLLVAYLIAVWAMTTKPT